jgi:hypothetical protein
MGACIHSAEDVAVRRVDPLAPIYSKPKLEDINRGHLRFLKDG